eukprot:TRINITY_DN23629_c1_g1_i1.p1 TRINITY_DN23629_c1_g1~~TRINITY_DN23629_c1_g1_i1.p1  ORF type:complete len:754 (-),score=141.86 TRINITY_DN23629_c1_g1_i1:56-2317(-)
MEGSGASSSSSSASPWPVARPLRSGTVARRVSQRRARKLRRTRSLFCSPQAVASLSQKVPSIAFHPEDDLASQVRARQEESARALLRYVDCNYDGHISREEFALLAEDPGVFEALDVNHVGVVDLDVFWSRFIVPWLHQDPARFELWLQRQWAHVARTASTAQAGLLAGSGPLAGEGLRYPLPERQPPPPPTECLQDAWENFRQAIAVDHITAIFEDMCWHLGFSPDSASSTSGCCGCPRRRPFALMTALERQLGGARNCVPALHARCRRSADRPLRGRRVAVVGAGPTGLRAAVEAALLGGEVHVHELREDFSRMNVLKLWGWAAYDLLSLGAKTLLPVFLVYRDIVGIQELQALLLKVCLLLGVRMHWGSAYKHLECEGDEWRLTSEAMEMRNGRREPTGLLTTESFAAVIAADGGSSFKNGVCKQFGIERVRADGLRAPLDWEIAVVANFHNPRQPEDRATMEMPRWFDSRKLAERDPRVRCAQVLYLAGDTHYFIMTVNRRALVEAGVFRDPSLPVGASDDSDTAVGARLTDSGNVDKERLETFVRIVASCYSAVVSSEGKLSIAPDFWARRHLAQDILGRPALATFGYVRNARHASRPLHIGGSEGSRRYAPLLVVGDALREPFWPKGEGCGRGFLGCLDAVWCLALWAGGLGREAMVEERQRLFELEATLTQVSKIDVMLPYTCNESFDEGSYLYTLDPATRYKVIKQEEDEDEEDGEQEEEDWEDDESSSDGSSEPSASCKGCVVH